MGDLVRKPLSQVLATLEKLDAAGLEEGRFDQLRIDPGYLRRVVAFANRGGIGEPILHRLARSIMGEERFFGLHEWLDLYGDCVYFTQEHLRQVEQFPWPEELLDSPCPFYPDKAIRETHSAFLGVRTLKRDRRRESLTIMAWHQVHPGPDQPKFYFGSDPWYATEDFAAGQTCSLRWHLLLNGIVPGSENKSWREQQEMLPEEYEVPTPIVEVVHHVFYYQKTGTYLNQNRHGRCNALSSGGYRVRVGYFYPDGLGVGYCGDGSRHGYLGLFASRRVPSQITK